PVHQSLLSMLIPLVIRAIFSILSGYVGVPPILGGGNHIEAFLAAPAPDAKGVEQGETLIEGTLMLISVGVAFGGAALAYLFYAARPEWPARGARRAPAMSAALTTNLYLDDITSR